LRSVVALVQSGDLPAERDQIAYLGGALAAVAVMDRE
jgi:hypothetical protein